MQAATNNGIKGDCKTQVCAETEVCVRTPPPQNGHVCVPVPADCGVPGVSGGSLQWNGTQQNDVAILTCDSGYELISDASYQLTCHVTSHWTPSTVTCLRVYAFFLFLSPRPSSRLFFLMEVLVLDVHWKARGIPPPPPGPEPSVARIRTGTTKIKCERSILRLTRAQHVNLYRVNGPLISIQR